MVSGMKEGEGGTVASNEDAIITQRRHTTPVESFHDEQDQEDEDRRIKKRASAGDAPHHRRVHHTTRPLVDTNQSSTTTRGSHHNQAFKVLMKSPEPDTFLQIKQDLMTKQQIREEKQSALGPPSTSSTTINKKSSILSKKKNLADPSYISYMDDASSKRISSASKKGRKSSTASGLGVGSHAVSSSSEKNNCEGTGPPSYLSYLDDEEAASTNRLSLGSIEPMAMPEPPAPVQRQETQPGAYASAGPGEGFERANTLRFSLVGLQDSDEFADEESPEGMMTVAFDGSERHQDDDPSSRTRDDSDRIAEMIRQSTNRLVVATQVDPTQEHRASMLPTAEGIDDSRQRRRKEKFWRKRRKYKAIAALVVAVGIVIIVLVALKLTNNLGQSSNSHNSGDDDIDSATNILTARTSAPSMNPTASPTRSLPPMENLEILYDDLPHKTKESLYDKDSIQSMAWEWLLHHPNITSIEEWRKKQIFAMSTLYYSFHGPSWPEATPASGRWMDYTNLDECSWVLNDIEVGFLTQQSVYILGPGAYFFEDYKPCNPDGELQTIVLNQVFLPSNLSASIPPEIELLTSLRIFGTAFSQIHSKLSDFLGVPEFINLPSLRALNFYETGITGSIPPQTFGMTNLRHLLLGGNKLSGIIPSEIAGMSSLEYINIHDTEGIGGKLPTELGLMRTLTGLDVTWSPSFTGTIPTQFGLLSNMEKLTLDGNSLTGSIPSQLGLLTGNRWLALYENRLTGSIPTELGLMTDTNRFRIWNNRFTGLVPSQLALMTNMVDFRIGNDLEVEGPHNNFVGFLPSELWEFSHLQWLHLPNLPNLRGEIPTEMMMPNLTLFSLSGSPNISGAIPDQVCIFVEELDFDCSDLLCGCDCHCGMVVVPEKGELVNNQQNASRGVEAMSSPDPIPDVDQEWPGLFPTPVNRPNAITINIRTDRHPEETQYEWSVRDPSGLWSILDTEEPQDPEKVHSYTKEVESNNVYRLELLDSKGDGTCCANGLGWFTITDSTPSPDHAEGTVIWEAPGPVLTGSYHVYIRVDQEGRAKVLEHLTGPRHLRRI